MSVTLPGNAQALKIGTTDTVAIGGTSAAQSAAVSERCTIARIVSDVDCFIACGSSPTATSSSMFLPANSVEYFHVFGGVDKFAVIQDVSAGTLYVTEMS